MMDRRLNRRRFVAGTAATAAALAIPADLLEQAAELAAAGGVDVLHPRDAAGEMIAGEFAGALTGVLEECGFQAVVFAAVELDQGFPSRAEPHLLVAEENAQAALDLSPPEFGALIRRDYDKYGKLVKDVGVEPE